MVSWEEPIQPNDFTWNYTLTITENTTGSDVNRMVLNMNVTHLNASTNEMGKYSLSSYL